MAKKIESTEEPVIKTTEEIKPETKQVTKSEDIKEDLKGKEETFKGRLEKNLICVGTKISYTVSGSNEPTEVIVDDAFLSLPIQELEYYEKFNYKIVK